VGIEPPIYKIFSMIINQQNNNRGLTLTIVLMIMSNIGCFPAVFLCFEVIIHTGITRAR
jgi:hypothetical protein